MALSVMLLGLAIVGTQPPAIEAVGDHHEDRHCVRIIDRGERAMRDVLLEQRVRLQARQMLAQAESLCDSGQTLAGSCLAEEAVNLVMAEATQGLPQGVRRPE